MPTYRYGTITWISGDDCNVTLEAATSSQQAIDVNQGTNLSNVPIEYMTCNGAAFAVDDVVLIEFINQDFTTPKVIGFKSNPQPCGARWVVFKCWAEDPGSPPTTYDAHYVVWDAQNAQLADLSAWSGPTVPGDYPCSEADLAAWVAVTTEIGDAPCYDWVEAGESIPSNDISENDGCEELVNSDVDSTILDEHDCPNWEEPPYISWDYEYYLDRFYPAYRGVPLVQGDSYNLEVVAGLGGEGETTCFRLEYTYDQDITEFQACYVGGVPVPPGFPAFTYFDRDYQYRRHCPLNRILDEGWLDTYQWLDEESGGYTERPPGSLHISFPYSLTHWEEFDTYFTGILSENQAVEKMARYTGTIMVQFYVFQASGQYKYVSGDNYEPWEFPPGWVYQDSPARLTDAKIAVDYHASDITGTDPRDQVSIPSLESKVEEAMDAAADEAGEGDKRCIDYFEMKMRQ